MLAYDKTSMQQQLIKALMKTGARDKAEQIGLKGKASRQDSFKQKSDWRQRGGEEEEEGVIIVGWVGVWGRKGFLMFLTATLHVFSKRDNSVLCLDLYSVCRF